MDDGPQTSTGATSFTAYFNANNLYKVYNGLVAAAVLYKYTTSPSASALEHLPDIAIHAYEAFLSERLVGGEFAKFAIMANACRGAQALNAAITGISSIPFAANVIDVGNHSLNILHGFSKLRSSCAPAQDVASPEADDRRAHKKTM